MSQPFQLPLEGLHLIEASAGTGKTYTIEHLVVDRLLKTNAQLEQILVVTFTDKAIMTIITKALTSAMNFLLAVLKPTRINPIIAEKIRVAIPYFSGINSTREKIPKPTMATGIFFIS